MNFLLQVGVLRDANLISKRTLVLFAAFCHLTLVVCGAAQLDFGDSLLAKPFKYYGALSGADSGYGFFAPGVGSQLRINVKLYNSAGQQLTTILPEPTNREASLRVGNVVGWFLGEGTDSRVRRSLAASWVGKALGKSPSATEAIVELEQYKLVSSAEFLAGKRPKWFPYYSAKFQPSRAVK